MTVYFGSGANIPSLSSYTVMIIIIIIIDQTYIALFKVLKDALYCM